MVSGNACRAVHQLQGKKLGGWTGGGPEPLELWLWVILLGGLALQVEFLHYCMTRNCNDEEKIMFCQGFYCLDGAMHPCSLPPSWLQCLKVHDTLLLCKFLKIQEKVPTFLLSRMPAQSWISKEKAFSSFSRSWVLFEIPYFANTLSWVRKRYT